MDILAGENTNGKPQRAARTRITNKSLIITARTSHKSRRFTKQQKTSGDRVPDPMVIHIQKVPGSISQLIAEDKPRIKMSYGLTDQGMKYSNTKYNK